MHGALVRAAHKGSVVGHVSGFHGDRRTGAAGQGADAAGRQLKGGISVAELPKACDTGTMRNAKGYREELAWLQNAYRCRRHRRPGELYPDLGVAPRQPDRHPTVEDDRGARGPLLRVDGRGYDSWEIGAHTYLTGRVAVTDANPRRDAELGSASPGRRWRGGRRHSATLGRAETPRTPAGPSSGVPAGAGDWPRPLESR